MLITNYLFIPNNSIALGMVSINIFRCKNAFLNNMKLIMYALIQNSIYLRKNQNNKNKKKI